jgi:hypothetical protein
MGMIYLRIGTIDFKINTHCKLIKPMTGLCASAKLVESNP